MAAVVSVLRTPLDQTGRLVSVSFFLLTLIPVSSVLAQFRFSRAQQLIILSLMLVSPYYVYWSRAFLIESTVLFMSVSFLAGSLRFLREPNLLSGTVAVVCGSIGGMVKITTFTPFLLAVCLLGACTSVTMYRESRRWQNAVTVAGRLILLLAPALVICVAWMRFCDDQRSLNRIGQTMNSAMLRSWIFGKWEQRLDWQLWSTIVGRYGMMIGDVACLGVCALGLLKSGRRPHIVGALLLALSAPLIFTNLYVHHEYYPYATGLFLIAAVGMSLTAIWKHLPWGRTVTAVGFISVLIACGYRYYYHCYPKLALSVTGPWLEPVIREIQKQTEPDEVILILGFDWSSEIPYYSRRRALMIPDWKIEAFLANPQPYLDDCRGHRLGGLVVADLGRLKLDPVAVCRAGELAGMARIGTQIYEHRFSVYSRHEADRTTKVSEPKIDQNSGGAVQPRLLH